MDSQKNFSTQTSKIYNSINDKVVNSNNNLYSNSLYIDKVI